MKVAMTGANGFLGWHTRAFLHSIGEKDVHAVPVGEAFDEVTAASAVSGAEKFLVIAGINRGTDAEVLEGNVGFAKQAARALGAADVPPQLVVFANSSQSGNGTVYGRAKDLASSILRDAAEAIGASFVDIRLPNLFGEHGRPFYNSVTATFCHLLSRGESPTVDVDRQLTLLHAQHAAEALVAGHTASSFEEHVRKSTVSELLAGLQHFAAAFERGDVPRLDSDFERDLFNTYRSFAFQVSSQLRLNRHEDARGGFTEIIRSNGGPGQISFSTTVPGVTRGQHYHRRKMERFTVLAGTGEIRLRRLFSQDVVSIPVDGSRPTSVDMPTFWAHSITNTGADELITMFWSNEIFDPAAPDTIPETV